MLTLKILSCYNHLVATSVLYFTIVDPLQELMHNSNNNLASDNQYLPSLVEATQDDPEKDYYEILGVNKDSTKHEIHKAFRHLAKKYHPDKNKDKGAQDEFIKIFKAYETLSDEKKRQEYDNRFKSPNHGAWQTAGSNMNNFDVNEFFRQYEEQLSKHAQHFEHHNHQHFHHHNQGQHDHLHHQFMFNGVNLDDLFHDIDEDELPSFGYLFPDNHHNNHIHSDIDGTFGDGASFFGTHFPSQLHNIVHQYQHHASVHGSEDSSHSCRTITKQANGMMMTQTVCS